jgi:type IX secretion system PorP/SprF family membrane protein
MTLTLNKLSKMMKVLVLPLVVLMSMTLHAQDVHFSQFYATPLLVNPAMTGIFDGKFRVTNDYRSQWAGAGDGYSTIHLSADMPLGKSRVKKNYFGLGLMVYHDNAGSSKFTHTIIEASLAYTLAVDDGDNYISIGFRSGLDSRQVDFTKATWDSQWNGDVFDPLLPGEYPQLQQRTFLDYSTGLMWYYIPDGNNAVCVGGSMSHFSTPDLSFFSTNRDDLNSLVTIHGSAELCMDPYRTFWVAPKVLVKMQGNQHETMVGTFLKNRLQIKSKYTNYRKELFFSYGAWYRLGDALILATRLDYNEFGLGISYDFTTSQFTSLTGLSGGPEFTLSYIMGVKKGQRSKHFNKMPKFF